MDSFRYVDLFAGIGGFRCGLDIAGGECVFSNEKDKFAADTYERWYKAEVDRTDFRDIVQDVDSWKSKIGEFDLLAGGFPCQPFSLAGVSKKKHLAKEKATRTKKKLVKTHGFDDPEQGDLFGRLAEFIDATRPPVVFLENVKFLKGHDGGSTWERIIEDLEGLQYHVFPDVIDASAWVPQHRERVFLVCFHFDDFGDDKADVEFSFPDPPKRRPKLKSILEKDPDPKYTLSDNLWKYLQDYKQKHSDLDHGFGFGVAEPDGQTRTLSSRYYKDGSEILFWPDKTKNPRRLTPREAAKLMGFVNKYAKEYDHPRGGFPIEPTSDSQAYRLLGNAVVPHVVEAIATEIVRTMKLAALPARRESSGN